jgi:phage gpG-like protein
MAHVGVDVIGDEKVNTMLLAMRARAKNFEPALRQIGDVLRLHNAAQFATEGMQGGKKWDPLSPKYAAWKLKQVGPRPILQFTGRLMEDLTGSPMAIEHYTADSAEWGTDAPYAVFHQSKAPRTQLPRRPFLVVTEALQFEAKRILADYVVGE